MVLVRLVVPISCKLSEKWIPILAKKLHPQKTFREGGEKEEIGRR
jgi:hypothetical protein